MSLSDYQSSGAPWWRELLGVVIAVLPVLLPIINWRAHVWQEWQTYLVFTLACLMAGLLVSGRNFELGGQDYQLSVGDEQGFSEVEVTEAAIHEFLRESREANHHE